MDLDICRYTDNTIVDEEGNLIPCGLSASMVMRMPSDIPDMPLCYEHWRLIDSTGWTFEDTLDTLVELIMEKEEVDFDEFLGE